jgi:alpha-ketoglutarate-dependent taurine dioxygenase
MTKYINIQGTSFHYNWLREHCPCCRYPSPYQQLYDTAISGDTEEILDPISIEISNNSLIIIWDEQPPHKSVFDIPAILKHSSLCDKKEIDDKNVYWNKDILGSFSTPEYSIQNGKISDESWLSQLQKFGFILLKDTSQEEMKSFLAGFSPLNESYFGKTFDLNEQNKKKKMNKPFKGGGCALPLHNDLTFWDDHKLLQFLYCEKSSPIGGDSILVDGFYVAEEFKRNFPEYFEILTSTKVEFGLNDPNYQYLFRNSSTILECDNFGKMETIRFSKRNCRPYFTNAKKMERFYEAYHALFNQLKNKENQFRYHLESKDCLMFQNFRLLHGRTAFDISLGGRKLHAGYYDWKYFQARLDFYANLIG